MFNGQLGRQGPERMSFWGFFCNWNWKARGRLCCGVVSLFVRGIGVRGVLCSAPGLGFIPAAPLVSTQRNTEVLGFSQNSN